MNELTTERDEKPIDSLYAQALQYPLLSAEEEQTIDGAKWQAVDDLQALLLDDEACRDYLQHWAKNLLEKPPSLEWFTVREQYNLLKRDQGELLAKGKHRAALVEFNQRLSDAPCAADDMATLAALHLPGVLVTGLAEVMLNEPEPREMAAALLYWGSFWPASQSAKPTKRRAGNYREIRATLNNYYTARSKLVNHNLRLVYAIAGRINGRGLPYEDLVQGGMLGLIRAAEKYNHKQGFRFSTYAYNWIYQSSRQAVENTQGIVRYPSGINEQISRMYRERLQHINATGSEPSVSYLAQRLQMEPRALHRLRQVTNQSVSLDVSVNDMDGGLSLGEILPGNTFEAPTRDADNQSLKRCLVRTLKVLQANEQQVVALRWGLEGLPPLSRAEVANQLEVSVEWVRQLEMSALAKLRGDKELLANYRDCSA